MKKKYNIAFVDDDKSTLFGAFIQFEDAFSKIDNDLYPFEIECKFEYLGDYHSICEFDTKMSESGYCGLVLDYSLDKIPLFLSAKELWEHIKSNKPLFPLAILTSQEGSVIKIDKENEEIFHKDNPDDYLKLVKYMYRQIARNIENKYAINRAINGLKNEDVISLKLLQLESESELEFEIINKDEVEDNFQKIIKETLELIDKYSSKG